MAGTRLGGMTGDAYTARQVARTLRYPFFDEPTSGLNCEMTKEMYLLLKTLHAAGKTILFASHRPEEIRTITTWNMVLYQESWMQRQMLPT